MAYEIELTTKEQIEELIDIANTISNALKRLPRKRMRDSERAMTGAKYMRAATAVYMAVDRLRAERDKEDAKALGQQLASRVGFSE